MLDVTIGFGGGRCLGVCTQLPQFRDSVHLHTVAGDMARRGQLDGVDHDELRRVIGATDEDPELLDDDDDDDDDDADDDDDQTAGPSETGSLRSWWKKVKRKTKKALKKVAKVAKAIVHSKVVSALYQSVKAATPPPYNVALGAVEAGARFGDAMLKGSKAARALLPTVQALAHGTISVTKASREAKKHGVHPDVVKNAALAAKINALAHAGDPKAAAIVNMHNIISNAGKSPAHHAAAKALALEATLRKTYPNARVYGVQMPDGSVLHSAVFSV